MWKDCRIWEFNQGEDFVHESNAMFPFPWYENVQVSEWLPMGYEITIMQALKYVIAI